MLASDPYRGLPCIYALAKDLVPHTEMRLDRENILAFIEAHQSVRTLTIGELWAIPQMLRIALIESIQNMAVTALADLRERQLADFWANRLIAANRRDANQLFGILAELAKAEPSPSPYFGVKLVGLLYDEAAALSAVQGWLERTLDAPLHEFHLREQNRQTREQISCGNAFTSLRQLALLDCARSSRSSAGWSKRCATTRPGFTAGWILLPATAVAEQLKNSPWPAVRARCKWRSAPSSWRPWQGAIRQPMTGPATSAPG
jgi:hypothetical protein